MILILMMIVFLLQTEETLYQYNWICHKCATVNEIYQWQSNLYEEEDEIEVNCCKNKDTLFKYTINFNNKKLLWQNNTDEYKNNAFENSNKMKIIKDCTKLSKYELKYIYDFEIIKVSKYDNDEEIKSVIVVSDELTDDGEYYDITRDEYKMEKFNDCWKNEIESAFNDFSECYSDEYCCCWKLKTLHIDAQKKIMEYAKNGDIIVYPDNTIGVVWRVCSYGIKEIVNVLEEGLHIIPEMITEKIKNPIKFYSKFIDMTNTNDDYIFIHGFVLGTSQTAQIIGKHENDILFGGNLYFNECYDDVYYKPLYLQLYDTTEKHKINIWNYL